MQMASVATIAGTAICCAPSRMATVSGLPRWRFLWMFSTSTVASSTSMPMASASPPRVMMLMLCPLSFSPTTAEQMASGIEVQTITIERQLPRNSPIISDTSADDSSASRSTRSIAPRTNTDWSKSMRKSIPCGAAALIAGSASRVASTTASVEASACLRMAR